MQSNPWTIRPYADNLLNKRAGGTQGSISAIAAYKIPALQGTSPITVVLMWISCYLPFIFSATAWIGMATDKVQIRPIS